MLLCTSCRADSALGRASSRVLPRSSRLITVLQPCKLGLGLTESAGNSREQSIRLLLTHNGCTRIAAGRPHAQQSSCFAICCYWQSEWHGACCRPHAARVLDGGPSMPGQKKRTFKAEDQLDQGGKAAKRHKKGRPAIRRLCKGMCYKDPRLEPGDMEWEGQLADQPSVNAPMTQSNIQQRKERAEPSSAAPAAAARPRLSGAGAMQAYLRKLQLDSPTPLQSRCQGAFPRGAGQSLSARLSTATLQGVAPAA